MKPNKKQEAVAKCMSSIISTFANTNDINSPTHIGDIETFVHTDLDDILDDEKFIEYIIEKLKMLYYMIKDIK